jgi:lysophospholipid acyltransferase (LPLAT)-like uncharacterized protein
MASSSISPFKLGAIAFTASTLIRGLGSTLRFTFEDHARFFDPTYRQQYIWSMWHNRMIMAPYMSVRYAPHRRGSALTSPSKDGDIFEQTVKRFGIGAVRGSSSKRGTKALLELQTALEQGQDICVTPDGPRGPMYEIRQPGIVYTASLSGVPILPIGMDYSRCWRLKSWDRFMIPKPFAKCRIRILAPLHVPGPEENPDLQAEAQRVREALMATIETV